MIFSVFQLLLALIVILAAAEFFTNALEHLGQRLQISQGVTGSLFAAVGTALPETVVPLLAIASATPGKTLHEEIGVGAILGAPLMLSTLSIFLMGLFVLRKRGLQGLIRPEPQGFKRDIGFFLVAFIIAALAMFIPHGNSALRTLFSLTLVILYFIYVAMTFRASHGLVNDGEVTQAEYPLLLTRTGCAVNGWSITVQLLLGTGIVIGGAFWFIHGVVEVSAWTGVSVLLMSLIIIPIATELPEKVNSILWIRRGKDTLAVGNITGALVFQGTILPAMGIMLIPWSPREEVLTSVMVTLVAATWLWLASVRKKIPLWWLLPNGLLYVVHLAITFYPR